MPRFYTIRGSSGPIIPTALEPTSAPPRAVAFFRWLSGRSGAVLAAYALLVPLALVFALRVGQDHSIERMIVESDPDRVATREFQRLFPERRPLLLLFESRDPFENGFLERVRDLEERLRGLPRVEPFSALSAAERLRPGVSTDPSRRAELRAFLLGTTFFRKQALVGDRHISIALLLDASTPAERDEALRAVDAALRSGGAAGAPLPVRRLGEPWVQSWLERQTRESSARFFPLFGAFVVLLNLFLFRSWRTLVAMLATLGVSVLLGTAVAGLLGYPNTIVSALVPLTLLITATASLVYIHARYVECPPGVAPEEHQPVALANKLLPVTASVFAAAVGFAALSVSKIRPIREMGIWTASGLLLSWVVCFTLFPALQRLLRTPVRAERALAGAWVFRAAELLPRRSYLWRWHLVVLALVLSAAGAVAVFGLPGAVSPMPLEVDSVAYLPEDLPLAEDARWFQANVGGRASFSLWVTTPPGRVVDPEFLAALDTFASRLSEDPRVGSVTGLTSVLRLRRYASGLGDTLPSDVEGLERAAADLEQLLLTEPWLRSMVDVGTLGATHLTVLTRAGRPVSIDELVPAAASLFEEARGKSPALAGCTLRAVGQGLLTEKIGRYLVPTLVESFVLTAAVIFAAFFFVFRSPAARLMAMVPSLFAILVMFLFMRGTGIPLNVATILIATTVLGASENDQVHFFYHFQEARRGGSCEAALSHAVRVAGSAIFFATVVNAGGFLALTLSDLPPMRQFGVLSSLAFVLSMLADFTALPAALWLVFRERPDREPLAD
ncbi:hypothetical protein FBQ97_05370 [Acidobacteria bacterium ACD]|nr:hypothetical protein [Acidobacteria bacterium ACD]